ncbi:arsenate reductase ArsC [Campylobacter sp. US33a]|uniref:Arsenate reductase ArsC n=1 Tax=Campylobacter sp. CCS1377 TaxID=3158229 RepID=A0AAU7E6N0_9BACT|nr:arsenate reductase ArsC [Campylobacter sp. US33a]TEY02076.1 arsenate reductase ArsC [Campylobacter sp. US33a]
MKIAFICVHNSCRSQMAEALARYKAKNMGIDIEVFSAGSDISKGINPQAIKLMYEIYQINMKKHYPKLINSLPKDLDIVVSMGCGVACPNLKSRYYFDFKLSDPSGSCDNEFKKIIQILDSKLTALLWTIKTNSLKGFAC